MKTQTELYKHRERCKTCGKKFLAVKKLNLKPGTIKTDKIEIQALPIVCNSYFCPNCAKKKQKVIYSKTINALKHESWRFITLTTINNAGDFNTTATLANNAWNKLSTLLRRRFKKMRYIKVLETGKNGMLHFHILTNLYIPQALLRYYWEKYTNAYIVDIRKVQSNKTAVNYIIKYIYKTFQDDHTNEQFFLNQKRRFSFSRNFADKFEKLYKLVRINPAFYSYNHILEFFAYLQSAYSELEITKPPPADN